MWKKDGEKQLSNNQMFEGYIVSKKGCQLGQWSYYKVMFFLVVKYCQILT